MDEKTLSPRKLDQGNRISTLPRPDRLPPADSAPLQYRRNGLAGVAAAILGRGLSRRNEFELINQDPKLGLSGASEHDLGTGQ
jgi:hypothetical protein